MRIRWVPRPRELRRLAGAALVLAAAAGAFWLWRSLLLWPFRLEQRIVVIADGSDSSEGQLSCWKRVLPGGRWRRQGEPVPVLLGRNGVAWGIGLHPPHPGLQKVEGDGRTPAGRFRIGLVLGTAPSLPTGARWPLYHRKSTRDAWIENPALPHYNHLVTVPDGVDPPEWFEEERLRVEDPILEWMVSVEHNYPESRAGAGSAIFLHRRYGAHAPTSGCLALSRSNLVGLIRWLDPRGEPELVVLTRADYLRLWSSWSLPRPEKVGLSGGP